MQRLKVVQIMMEDKMIYEFPNGMTVKELKEVIKQWPEVDEHTGEDCEVWITTGKNLSSPVICVYPLNLRMNNGKASYDILLDTNAFDV
jgi:hypothetical protein